MASIDKAAIGFTIAIVAVGAGFAFYGEGAQNTTTVPQPPATPTVEPDMTEPEPQMSPPEETSTEETMMEDESMMESEEEAMTEEKEEEAMMEDESMMESEETMMESEETMMESEEEAMTEEKEEEAMMEDESMMESEETMMEEKEEEPAVMDEMQATQTHIVDMPVGTAVPGCETTNECYIPASLTINVGDTVEWINSDSAAHTVTSGTPSDGPSGDFDSSLVLADAAFAFTFEESGNYDYFCLVHPWMSGNVQVN